MSLDRDIATWIKEARGFAHAPQNWLHIDNGDTIQSRGFASILRHREHAPGFESVVFFEYSVDVVTQPTPRKVRHLSVTLDVYGELTQGAINAQAAGEFGEKLLTPIVRQVFPLHDNVELVARSHEPRPVVTPDGQATMRTRVTFHVLVDHESTAQVAGVSALPTQPRQAVVLYGPDGRPAR